MQEPLKVQLALQGGGAKLTAILAVLDAVQELERKNVIWVTRLAGTSAGSLAAALFAMGKSIDGMRDTLKAAGPQHIDDLFPDYGKWRIASRLLRGKPIWDEDKLRNVLQKIFQERTLGQLSRPVIITTTDLTNRQLVAHDKQETKVVQAILDSCALPFLLRPASSGSYFDGGICATLPAEELVKDQERFGSIIGITFESPSLSPRTTFEFALSLLATAMEHSVARAREVAHDVFQVKTSVTTFGFKHAYSHGLGDEYDRIKVEATTFFDELSRKHRTTKSESRLDRFIAELRSKLDAATFDFSDETVDGVVNYLQRTGRELAGINAEFANRLKQNLRLDYNGLYFVDILGSAYWIDPTFLLHMAYQIRHYVKKNFTVDNGDLVPKWHLDFTDPLRSAICRCHAALPSLGLETLTQFSQITEQHVPNPALVPKYEIARILIWPPSELRSVPGEVLVHLHKVMKIPLFWLNPEVVSASDVNLSRYEYHVFFGANKTPFGEYYDKQAGGERKNFGNVGTLPKGMGSAPLTNFQWLLRHQQLVFAADKLTELSRTR